MKAEHRRIVALVAVLLALVAVSFGRSLFGTGVSSPRAVASAGAASPPGAAPGVAPASSGVAPSGVVPVAGAPVTTPPTFRVYGTKNPFEPVIQLETATPTTVPTTSGPPVTSVNPVVPNGSTTTTLAPARGQAVTLADVYRDAAGTVRAHVQVATIVYTVGEGATFAGGRYRVVSLTPPCGQFLFGDAPFRLCQGEQTLK